MKQIGEANAEIRRDRIPCLTGAHLIADGHGHTPVGCPGVRLEALQMITVCLRLSRPITAPIARSAFKGAGRRETPTFEFT